MNIGWFIFLIILFIIAYLSNENNRVGNKYSKCYRVLLILILSYIVGFGGVVATDHEKSMLICISFMTIIYLSTLFGIGIVKSDMYY